MCSGNPVITRSILSLRSFLPSSVMLSEIGPVQHLSCLTCPQASAASVLSYLPQHLSCLTTQTYLPPSNCPVLLTPASVLSYHSDILTPPATVLSYLPAASVLSYLPQHLSCLTTQTYLPPQQLSCPTYPRHLSCPNLPPSICPVLRTPQYMSYLPPPPPPPPSICPVWSFS